MRAPLTETPSPAGKTMWFIMVAFRVINRFPFVPAMATKKAADMALPMTMVDTSHRSEFTKSNKNSEL